jgi:hypothetical protein
MGPGHGSAPKSWRPTSASPARCHHGTSQTPSTGAKPVKPSSCLHRLMEAGSRHPLVVLAILHRHFGNILRVQSPDIATEAQAAEALGIAKGRSTFPARKALDAARRLGMRGSGDAVIALADAELALKGKLDWEPEAILEVLVARLCRLSRNARGAPYTLVQGGTGGIEPGGGGSKRRWTSNRRPG